LTFTKIYKSSIPTLEDPAAINQLTPIRKKHKGNKEQIMFRTINPSTLRLNVGVGLGVSSVLIGQQFLLNPHRRVIYCQSATTATHPSSVSQSSSWFSQNKPAQQVQLEETTENQIFNPVAFRQISSGSFIGLLAGIAVGKISKILAFAALAVALGVQVWKQNYSPRVVCCFYNSSLSSSSLRHLKHYSILHSFFWFLFIDI